MDKKNIGIILKVFVGIMVALGVFILLKPIYDARVVEKHKFKEAVINFEDKLKYNNQKDVQKNSSSINIRQAETEVVGVIYIPKLDLALPIFYGIDENSLSTGAGTMVEYGLPSGKKGTHAVLTSHSGISSSGLFSNINQLNLNDIYYIKDRSNVLTKYRVVDINKVLPSDFSHLDIDKNKSFTTLLTCTPIGVNTHRLLVKGENVGVVKQQELEKADTKFTLSDYEKNVLVVLGVSSVLFLGVYFISNRKKIKGGDV